MKMELRLLIFMPLLFNTCSLTVLTRQLIRTRGNQGQNVNITWTVDLHVNKTWNFVKVYQGKDGSMHEMINFSKPTGKYVYSDYIRGHAELKLTTSQNGTLLTSVLIIKDQNQSTDEHQYYLQIGYSNHSVNSSNLQKTIAFEPGRITAQLMQTAAAVPTVINISISSPVTVTVGETVQLVCNATGHPTPSIKWTRDGVNVSTRSPFTTSAVKIYDDKSCYTCIAYNGVLDAKTANVCLNVQYKPYRTNLTSALGNTCLNDSITLRCTTDANPPAYEYRFYLNDMLVHTSMSGVYQLKVPHEGNNTYKCEPVNNVGAGQNGTTTVSAKVPPQIAFSTPDQMVVEGSAVVLMCNVTGSEPLNVTWSRVGGSSYPEGSIYTFSSIGRGDEATYRCTAHNGNECPEVNATSSITVIYKPENTNLTASKATVLPSDNLTLTCDTHSKPNSTKYRFYQNDSLIQTQSNKTYSFPLSVNGTIIYKCQPENSAGNGTTANVTVNVKVPPAITSDTENCETTEENKILFAVLVALIAVSIFLNIIFIAVIIWLCRKVSKDSSGKRLNDHEERGQNNNISLQEISFSATDNEAQDVPQNEQTRTGRLAGSDVGVSPYARWTIKTKPTKPSPGEHTTTENETPGVPLYEPMGHERGLAGSNVGISPYARWTIKTKPTKPSPGEHTTTENKTPGVPLYEPMGHERGLAGSDVGISHLSGALPYTTVLIKTNPTKVPSNAQQTNTMHQYDNPNLHRLPEPDKKTTQTTFQTFKSTALEYGSLSPSTRLPPKNKVAASTGSPTCPGEYQPIQRNGVASQYQSLNHQTKC